MLPRPATKVSVVDLLLAKAVGEAELVGSTAYTLVFRTCWPPKLNSLGYPWEVAEKRPTHAYVRLC